MRQQPQLGFTVGQRPGEGAQVAAALSQKEGQHPHAHAQGHQLHHGEQAVDAVGGLRLGVLLFAPAHRGVVGQRVVGRNPGCAARLHVGQDQRAGGACVQRGTDHAQLPTHQVLWWTLGGAHGDVGVSARQAHQFIARMQFVYQGRVPGLQHLQGGGDEAVQEGVGGGDAHRARHLLGLCLRGRAGGLQGGFHALGLLGQGLGQL